MLPRVTGLILLSMSCWAADPACVIPPDTERAEGLRMDMLRNSSMSGFLKALVRMSTRELWRRPDIDLDDIRAYHREAGSRMLVVLRGRIPKEEIPIFQEVPVEQIGDQILIGEPRELREAKQRCERAAEPLTQVQRDLEKLQGEALAWVWVRGHFELYPEAVANHLTLQVRLGPVVLIQGHIEFATELDAIQAEGRISGQIRTGEVPAELKGIPLTAMRVSRRGTRVEGVLEVTPDDFEDLVVILSRSMK